MAVPGVAIRISAGIAELRAAMAAGRAEFGKFGDAAASAASRAQRAMAALANEVKAGFNQQLAAQRKLANLGDSARNWRQQGRDERGRFLAMAGAAKEANAQIATLGTSLRGLLGPLSAVAAAIAAVKLSDDFVNLNARLKLATGSTQAATAAFTALFDIAQSRGGSLKDLGDLYVRLGLATQDAGVSQGALLKISEAVADAVLISGSSVETANAALIQFGQGLASNRLSGDELRSILEQLPPLADAIAKGMGVTRGELRKLGEDGKLTTQIVLKAVLSQQAALEEQARSIPITFGRAFQKLRNAALTLVEPFQSAFSAISTAISDFADFLSSDAVLGTITGFVTEVKLVYEDLKGIFSSVFSGATTDVENFVTEFGKLFHQFFVLLGSTVGYDEFVANTKTMVKNVIDGFRNMPSNIVAFLKIITLEFARMTSKVVVGAQYLYDVVKAIFTNDTIEAAGKRRDEALAATEARFVKGLELALATNAAQKEAAQLARETAEEERRGRRAFAEFQKTKVKTGGGKPAALTKEQENAARALRKAEFDAEEKLTKDARQRSLQQLDIFNGRKLLTEEQFIDARAALELKAIDELQAIEKKRIGLGGKEAIEARGQLEILENEKTDIVRKREEERHQIRRAFAEANKNLEADVLEAGGRAAEAEQLRLKLHFDKAIKDLIDSGNLAGAELMRAIFSGEQAKLQMAQLQSDFDKFSAIQNAREESLANQQATGALSAATAEGQLRESRQKTLVQLDEILVKMRELAALNPNNPTFQQAVIAAQNTVDNKIIESATGIDAAVINLRKSLSNLQASFASLATNAAVDAVANLFESLGDRTKSAGEKLRDFVRGFAQSMLQIAARALATYAILSLLEAVFPGAGKIAAAAGSASAAGVRHGGGIIGSNAGPRRRNVNPVVFAGAPRYHSGGVAGIAPNEQATILQKGEEVITAGDPRHANNGGRGGNVRIINMLDQGNIHNAMSSAGGEKVIMNALRANASGVRQILSQG